MKNNKYVDLGLPSGTLWKNTIEDGYFSYDEAFEKFGNNLPTEEQFQELINECMWEWDDTKKRYEVKGENGNSIVLPAAGYRNCYGSVDGVGSYGRYWSSTHSDSSFAMYLYLDSGDVDMDSGYRCLGRTVNLCKAK